MPIMMQATPPPLPTQATGQDVLRAQLQGGSPRAVYEALKQQRIEIDNQIDRLQDQRSDLARELQEPKVAGSNQTGIEQRITAIDQRLVDLDRQMAEADAAVARAAVQPGAVVLEPPRDRSGPPEEVFVLTGLFFIIVLLPLSIAFARRIWRRGAALVTALPQEIHDRFTRIEQSLDSIAIEVERVGEGQRFLTRMQAQQQERALGSGPAERVEVGNRERERQELGKK